MEIVRVFFFIFILQRASACSSGIIFGGGGRRDAEGQPVANGSKRTSRGPVATVTNRCDWENQTVGAEPNTRYRLETVDRLQTVNLLANPNGPVRSKRGLKLQRINCVRSPLCLSVPI
jgi:hypothetical protein